MLKKSRLAMSFAVCLIATAAFAQQQNPAMMARKAQMSLNMYYLATIGGMARGKLPYDAGAAKKAADLLVALAGTDWSGYWAAGTDNAADPQSKMLPAVYDNLPDLAVKQQGLEEAALKLQAVAGTGQDKLGPAVEELLSACNACHKPYRAPLR